MMAGIPARVAPVLYRGGLNRIGAAGILGNAYAESTWKPGSIGSGGGGLWGFTSPPNSLADLQAYARGRHRSWKDPGLQAEFLLHHVSPGLIGKLNAASSPEDAARIFMSEWERPGIPRQEVRESGARRAYRMLGRVGEPPARIPGEPKQEPHEAEESGLGGSLMNFGVTAALVAGGAVMILFGSKRVLGSARAG